MLEVLVHFEMDASEVPDTYQLLEVDFEGRKGISRLSAASLNKNWKDDLDYTRSVGDDWLQSLSSVLLKVPSVVVPHSFNYLMNPRHELADNAKIVSATQRPFDTRLI